MQLQTFCGERKVIQYSSRSAFVFLWIWKYGGHLFRACCWISTLCRMFAILSRRITKLFSLQQNVSPNLAFFLASPRCFNSFVSVLSYLFFLDHLGENIHEEELSAFCKIKRRPSMVATRKTTLWFSAVYKSIPSLYYVFLAHQHGHKYNFTTALENPTEYNKNAVCFIYCTSSPHQVNHKTKRKPVWFRMQCKHLDYM